MHNVQTNLSESDYETLLKFLDTVYCDQIVYDHFGYDSYYFSDGSFISVDHTEKLITIYCVNDDPYHYATNSFQFRGVYHA